MTPDQVKASYRRALQGHVSVRRYTGVGTSRPSTQIDNIRARIVGYAPTELIGTIQQGDRRAVLYADDVDGSALGSLKASDKIIEYGRELQIVAVDSSTRRVGDVLIAYEVQVRG